MFNKVIFTVLFGTLTGINATAQATPELSPGLAGSAAYSDPGFQDFIETSYGYLNPSSPMRQGRDFRDAPSFKGTAAASAPKPAAAKPESSAAAKYVFVSIAPKARNYASLLEDISASAGFIFYGERLSRSKTANKVRIVGWARADRLTALHDHPGVAGVRVGKVQGLKPGTRRR